MPSIEINRRIVGRGIMQRFLTDDGGEDMVETGQIVNYYDEVTYNIGFKPKVVIISTEELTGENLKQTSIYTSYGYTEFYDVFVQQNVSSPTLPTEIITFNDMGFTLKTTMVMGYFIAIR